MSFESIDFKCKEHLIWYFLKASDPLRKINLSHYDFQFMSNMQSLTHEKKEITSNQASLFDKLISKYIKNRYECLKPIDVEVYMDETILA